MIEIIRADASRIPLADASVDCVVTSPPYWGLRDYGVECQIGLEPSPQEWLDAMRQVFRDVYRVLIKAVDLWIEAAEWSATA